MARTESTMLPLGTTAPDFQLHDVVTNQVTSLATFSEFKVLLVMFICKHCPYVVHVKDELLRLARDYSEKEVAIVAISSNDAEAYPDDSPESLKQFAIAESLPFILLYDPSQETAKAYSAACTPDFFLFSRDRSLIYRGQLDDSRPGNNIPITGNDLRAAIDAALADKPVSADQKASLGCNIKWKAGNEPTYFAVK
ncbi:MAG: thioredoxin family protein [Candidatus Melainabacteria bacterium]|nr:thioredoxin family protein [Candidatus Melainabacteria bacterium]